MLSNYQRFARLGEGRFSLDVKAWLKRSTNFLTYFEMIKPLQAQQETQTGRREGFAL